MGLDVLPSNAKGTSRAGELATADDEQGEVEHNRVNDIAVDDMIRTLVVSSGSTKDG
jgi:hypothetical protein